MYIKKALCHSNLIIAITVMAKVAMSKHTMNVLGFNLANHKTN